MVKEVGRTHEGFRQLCHFDGLEAMLLWFIMTAISTGREGAVSPKIAST